jgi:hypothetical protein
LEKEERKKLKILVVTGFENEIVDVQFVEQIFRDLSPEYAAEDIEIVLSHVHTGIPSSVHIDDYAYVVAEELKNGDFNGVVAHSQGGMNLRASWKCFKGFDGPIVFVECPHMGVALWKLMLMTIKGVYPLTRACIRDLWKWSKFMRSIKDDHPAHNNRVLFVLGSFSQWSLARDVFISPPYYRSREILFPTVGHRELMTSADRSNAILSSELFPGEQVRQDSVFMSPREAIIKFLRKEL